MIKFIHSKLSSGALQLSMWFAVISVLLLSFFISYHFLYQQTLFNYRDANRNNLVGQELLLCNLPKNNNCPTGKEFTKSTINWGVFLLQQITYEHRTKPNSTIALLGGSFEEHPFALYITEPNRSLSLVGNTQIEGNVLIPNGSLKTGRIAGRFFENDVLLSNGILDASPAFYPSITAIQRQALLNYFDESFLFEISGPQISFTQQKETYNSFYDETLLVYSSDEILLHDTSFIGNILIYSPTKIEVYQSAILKDVLLIAPEIVLHEGVKVNVQVFATQKIDIKNDVELTYPSALTVLKSAPRSGIIKIASGARIDGVVLSIRNRNFELDPAEPSIHVDGGSIVGQLYAEDYVRFKGNFTGNFIAHGLVVREKFDLYLNHILDAKFSEDAHLHKRKGLLLQGSENDILKWLY